MMIHMLQYSQIPECINLLKRAYKKSIYFSSATLDDSEIKSQLADAIKRHGHKNAKGTLMLAAQHKSKITGLLWGVQCPLYPGLKELMVTDQFFIVEPDGDPHDALRMLRMLISWAKRLPNVIEVCVGANDSLNSDWASLNPLYRRVGLNPCGTMYRYATKEMVNEQSC